MWREGDSDRLNPSAFVFNPAGLFPAPLGDEEVGQERGKKVMTMFRVLGQFTVRMCYDYEVKKPLA